MLGIRLGLVVRKEEPCRNSDGRCAAVATPKPFLLRSAFLSFHFEISSAIQRTVEHG